MQTSAKVPKENMTEKDTMEVSKVSKVIGYKMKDDEYPCIELLGEVKIFILMARRL